MEKIFKLDCHTVLVYLELESDEGSVRDNIRCVPIQVVFYWRKPPLEHFDCSLNANINQAASVFWHTQASNRQTEQKRSWSMLEIRIYDKS